MHVALVGHQVESHIHEIAQAAGYSVTAPGPGLMDLEDGHGELLLRGPDGHLVQARYVHGQVMTAANGAGALVPLAPTHS